MLHIDLVGEQRMYCVGTYYVGTLLLYPLAFVQPFNRSLSFFLLHVYAV